MENLLKSCTLRHTTEHTLQRDTLQQTTIELPTTYQIMLELSGGVELDEQVSIYLARHNHRGPFGLRDPAGVPQ